MVHTAKGPETMTDPKQLLDEEIEEALVEEQVVMTTPKQRHLLGALAIDGKWVRPLAVVLGTSVAISSIVASIAVVGARVRARRVSRFTDMVVARRPRRFGYSRLRFGRFGQVFVTYTYKIPAVRIHVPRLTYKIPRIRVKLPVSSR